MPRLRVAMLAFMLPSAALAQAAATTLDTQPEAARFRRIEARLWPGTPLATDPDTGWSVSDRMRAHHVPGMSVAVVHDGRVAWARAYGVREAGAAEAISLHTLFQGGSISKPLASIALLQLVAAGTLSLDAPINTALRRWHVPDTRFTAAVPLTLRHLLTHRGGVTVRGFDGYRRGQPVPSLVEVLQGAAPANSPAITVDTTPGTIGRYSGGGFTIAQLALEDQTGLSFDVYAERRLFAPLGLTRSTYRTVRERDFGGDLATGHDGEGHAIEGRWHDLPEMAAASLWSTPTELAQVIIALQRAVAGTDTRLLPTTFAREMMTPQAPTQGLGIGLRGTPPTRFSHSGANDGYRAMFIGYLDKRDGIVVMTNGDDGDALAMEYVRAVAREYGWQDLAPVVRHVTAPTPAQRAALAGRYRIAPGRELDIIDRDGTLLVGPVGRRPFPLMAESDHAFIVPAIDGVEVHVLVRDATVVTAIEWWQGAQRLRAERIIGPDAIIDAPDRTR